MRILALDIGARRTGIAFVDTDNNIPLPLDTVVTDSVETMVEQVTAIASVRKIDKMVIGLPLLPSGEEGSQSTYVRDAAGLLTEKGFHVVFFDERYTSSHSSSFDDDARAACQLLTTYLQSQS